MPKRRVLLLFTEYPTLSQTYKENEIKYLYADNEIRIVSTKAFGKHYTTHFPYSPVTKYSEVADIIADFKPDVIHGHYLHSINFVHRAAKAADIPFSLRTHSFDVIGPSVEVLSKYADVVNSDLCLGILAFPFLREKLARSGINEDKILDTRPVVDFERFYDRSPNGDGILNVGSCLPKKDMESFFDLAVMMPDRTFSLYPIGYFDDRVEAYNESRGRPVVVKETVEPADMPPVYKRQEWLCYSCSLKEPVVGWPIAIAEAQAAGVGVLMRRVRPDLAEYVGEAGYLYDTLDEAKEILSQPFPADKRELGFAQAKKSDIKTNIRDLRELWEQALA